jgi:hypothetical protein
MFFAAKETWMLSSLVDYYYITSSKEAMDVLINVKEPHDKVCTIIELLLCLCIIKKNRRYQI